MATQFSITDTTPAVVTDWDSLQTSLLSMAVAGTATETELVAIASSLMKAYKATMRQIAAARWKADGEMHSSPA